MAAAEAGTTGYRPGDSVAGHLRIEALLGQGGAGAVYRVRDERKGGRLALKQLRAPDDEHKALLTSQFAREYHTLCQLAHPRIIEVYDYGVDRGCPYYTMELLDGQDLRDRGKLPFRTACELLRDVASSLAIVHSRGMVHRDVSARNVRCTSDGRAKLMDFGAMVPAGSSLRAVGTPPFVPPEVLQNQAIDARADLYGLGALAYWTLTGRHAYPAQTFQQLREAWRRPPRKPSDYAADTPPALSDLVMSLLKLDRDERPRTAAEVMERMSGIAGLTIQELPQVGRAYLITPSLVGRAVELQEVRRVLFHTLQTGRGAALLIEGAPGVGRSRFLDACVLEAKLLGALVLRGAPADAAQGDYGVARAVLQQLVEALPELCQQTAAPRAALLAHVLPGLAPRTTPARAPERRHIQVALRDFVLTIARSKHLVIAVDDLGAIDEPSIALLGALSHGAQRRRLSLLLTSNSTESAAAGVGVVRELAQRVELHALDAAQVETLLCGLFGDSPRLSSLAARLYELSSGKPREVMALAEHLVSNGRVRYEAGSWSLPHELTADDLPRSDREAAERRIAALGPDARELAEALSLANVRALSLPDYARLTEHGDAGRTFQALDELLRMGILVAEADRYRLAASDALAPLAAALTKERARTMHARLAQVLPAERRSAARLMHLLRGGHEQDAIATLLSEEPDELYAGRLEALALAAEAADRLASPLPARLDLHYRVARVSAVIRRPEWFERYGWPLIERLRRDSGLLDYEELSSELGERERLAQSFRLARERYEAAPPAERGFSPEESMQHLVAMYGSCNALAGTALDLPQLERLGSLAPWLSVSPAIGLVQRILDSSRATHVGRFDVAMRDCREIISQLDQADGVIPATVKTIRLAMVSALAVMRASEADASCEQWLAQLDTQPGYRGNAWRSRMVYQLAIGDLERASEYERRAELLDLQDSGGVAQAGLTHHTELLLNAVCDNLTGVKRVGERIERGVPIYPCWSARFGVAQAHYRRLQGDAAGGLLALTRALETTSPGRHVDWGLVRYTQLQLLVLLGRAQEATSLAVEYLADSARLAIKAEYLLKGIAAQAFAAAGRHAEAERLADENLAEQAEHDIGGVRLGLAYEARARVAIAAADTATFTTCAERCAEQYLRGRSPSLRARYERLLQDAADAKLSVPNVPQTAADEPVAGLSDEARTVYSRMLTAISPAERAERALQLLLEATGAQTGYFYGLRSGKLAMLFSPEQIVPAPALGTMLENCLERELVAVELAPVDEASGVAPQPVAAPLGRFIDDLGRAFEPLVLMGRHHGETMIAGVAALHYPEDDRPPARRAVLDAVIEALITEDVVDPITCVT